MTDVSSPQPSRLLRVVNPATGQPCGETYEASAEEVEEAVIRARRAQPAWAALSFSERARALRRLLRRLVRDRQLLPILISESGKPRYEAEAIELFYTCELTRYYTGRAGRRALQDEQRHPFLFFHKRARLVYHARGVVAVIGPWNWPLLNNFADAVAPLSCGNVVVLKPSPLTPLTSLHVAKLWREEGLPENVFQVVVGGGETGQALVDAVDMVFFTGSQTVGRQIARRAGERLIPCVLELGGKSAMVVLADADLGRAARAAVWSAFAHSGQVCVRTERLIVERPAAEELTRLCVAEMAKLTQGPPDGDGVGPDIGTITSARQIEHAERHIAEALEKGARIAAGGKRRTDLPGSFFEPTLLVNVTAEMAVAREETFAPVLPIVTVADTEEAMRLANDSPFGLSGSVWSRDKARATRLARELVAGSVCVNDALVNYFCVEAPLGGVRASGLGVRHGPEALRQFCRLESIVDDHPVLGLASAFAAKQIGFPYRSRVLGFFRWIMRRFY